MADETSAANPSKEKALDLFNKVRKLAQEIMMYQMKGKENKFEFYNQIGMDIRSIGQNRSGVLAMSILPGTEVPAQWQTFDVAGAESIMGKILEKYVEIKKVNPDFGSVDMESAQSLLSEVQEMAMYEGKEEEVLGVEINEQDLQEIGENRDFILTNSDTGKGNDRIGEFLSVVSKNISKAKMFSVWHKLVAGTQQDNFLKQDFPEPFSARNFLIAEKVRLQAELLNKTEAGQAIIQAKLDELGQAGGSGETVLAQILQGKDVYMEAIQAGQGGGDFNIDGSFDAADEAHSLEKFMDAAFQDGKVQEQLTEIRPKRIKAEPARSEQSQTEEKPIETEGTEPETNNESPEKPRWPMK